MDLTMLFVVSGERRVKRSACNTIFREWDGSCQPAIALERGGRTMREARIWGSVALSAVIALSGCGGQGESRLRRPGDTSFTCPGNEGCPSDGTRNPQWAGVAVPIALAGSHLREPPWETHPDGPNGRELVCPWSDDCPAGYTGRLVPLTTHNPVPSGNGQTVFYCDGNSHPVHCRDASGRSVPVLFIGCRENAATCRGLPRP